VALTVEPSGIWNAIRPARHLGLHRATRRHHHVAGLKANPLAGT